MRFLIFQKQKKMGILVVLKKNYQIFDIRKSGFSSEFNFISEIMKETLF